jgi:hypothetical protein
MKLKLARRRWLILAVCLAGIVCGLVLIHDKEAHRRYQRMLASYERVRMGMTRSEVEAAVGLARAGSHAWTEMYERNDHWQVVVGDNLSVGATETARSVVAISSSSCDAWVDHPLIILVRFQGGKAIDKSLVKATPDWPYRLRRLFTQD